MALIRCKNCGHSISDKATACPKCGAENIVEKQQPLSGDATQPKAERFANKQVEEGANNNIEQPPQYKSLYLLPILIVLVVILGVILQIVYK